VVPFIGFAVAMFMFYSLVPILLKVYQQTMFPLCKCVPTNFLIHDFSVLTSQVHLLFLAHLLKNGKKENPTKGILLYYEMALPH
jgi:hypothetical protein